MTDRYDRHQQFLPPPRVTIATGVDMIRQALVCATIADLKALRAGLRDDGQEVVVTANNSHWRFDAASTAVDVTDSFVVSPTSGTGKWIRTDGTVEMKLAVAFGTADAAVLFTVPAGMKIQIEEAFWEVTADWTGGTSSAIGLSSATAPHETKGDLLGGSAGSVLANLTTTIGHTADPRGASLAATPFIAVLPAAAVVRFDRITSAFTAGTGFAHLIARRVQ